MAAEQAAEIAEEDVIVIPSVTVPQGLVATLAFNPSLSLEENEAEMKESLSEVQTGLITFAVRDTSIDGITIEKNDYMGIKDGKIVEANKDLVQASCNLLSKMVDEDAEILTVLYGEDTAASDVEAIEQYINETLR